MAGARNTEVLILLLGCVIILTAIVLISNTLVRHLEATDSKMNELNAQLISRTGWRPWARWPPGSPMR